MCTSDFYCLQHIHADRLLRAHLGKVRTLQHVNLYASLVRPHAASAKNLLTWWRRLNSPPPHPFQIPCVLITWPRPRSVRHAIQFIIVGAVKPQSIEWPLIEACHDMQRSCGGGMAIAVSERVSPVSERESTGYSIIDPKSLRPRTELFPQLVSSELWVRGPPE